MMIPDCVEFGSDTAPDTEPSAVEAPTVSPWAAPTGTFADGADAAREYLKRGLMPIPLDGPRTKKVTRPGWPKERYTAADAPRFAGVNVGLLLGEPSGGLNDVDSDCPEAIRAAAVLLPNTRMVSERAGAPRSHYWYRCHPQSATALKLHDPERPASHPDGNVLIELRNGTGNALMTVVPPSLHEGTGEAVVWHEFGEPGEIGAAELEGKVKEVAAAALIGRYWVKGMRHDGSLPLAGGLLRAWGGDEARVEQFVRAVCAAADEDETGTRDRVASVRHTAEKLTAGDPKVTGWPKLAEYLGDAVVSQAREWLGIRDTVPATTGGTTPPPVAPEWPDPPHEAAFHGLAGDLVRAVDQYTEADPAAVLVQFLVMFGNRIGRTAYYPVGVTRHYCNLYAVLVGSTSNGRKGTSKDVAFHLFREAERLLAPPPADAEGPAVPPPDWLGARVVEGGLSSGEGIIWAVRDPVEKTERVKERGEPVRFEKVVADEGEEDKRLMVVEPEFANVLKQTERQGNVLSATLRQAWETGSLRTLTKNNPTRATGAHISAVGHITDAELKRYLSQTETANGFANRFLWVAVRRSKALPEPTAPPDDVMRALAARLADAVRFAESAGEVRRDDDARQLWAAVYGPLSGGRPGLSGSLLGRAEAQVTRLALLYALLDGSDAVCPVHLTAALALWEYVERSVAYVFGDSLGDPVADDCLRLIRQAGTAGISRTDIQGYFGRHVYGNRLTGALGLLRMHGKAHPVATETAGRPAECWFPGPAPA